MRPAAALLALGLAACATQPAPTTPIQVVMIGDSTAAPYGPERYPQLGWAQVLPCAMHAGVTVVDDAKGGRSTKSFQAEGWWDKARDRLKPGDVLLIQFGHNDATKEKPERYIEPRPGFADNLRLFVTAARTRGATPVLITPVAKLAFRDGKPEDVHGEYDDVVREVARDTSTALIDLDADSQALLAKLGPEKGKALYLYLPPGQYPYFKDGSADNTHFTETGARQVAGLVARRLATLDTPLKGRIDADSPALRASFLAHGPACAA